MLKSLIITAAVAAKSDHPTLKTDMTTIILYYPHYITAKRLKSLSLVHTLLTAVIYTITVAVICTDAIGTTSSVVIGRSLIVAMHSCHVVTAICRVHVMGHAHL